MRRAIIWLVVSMAPGPLLAQDAQRPAAVDTAKLTFRWPATTRARVDARRYRERHIGAKHDTSDVGLSYRMIAERSGEEYVVRFDDFQLGGPSKAMGRAPEVAAFIERMGGLMPSYRVSAAGEFTRLESPETIRALIDSLLTALTPKDGPPPPQLKQVMSTMTSDAVLSASAAQEWNALVGSWIGGELEVGEVYGTEGEEPIPMFQNAMIKFAYEFSALRRMPCDSIAAPAARDCVELPMVSKPDTAAMRQFLERFMGTLMPDAAKGIGFADFNVENVVILVARPESLLPVHLTVSKEVVSTVRAEGTTEKVHQIDVKTQKYTYDE
jgi:hypothetical protein